MGKRSQSIRGKKHKFLLPLDCLHIVSLLENGFQGGLCLLCRGLPQQGATTTAATATASFPQLEQGPHQPGGGGGFPSGGGGRDGGGGGGGRPRQGAWYHQIGGGRLPFTQV